MKRIEIDIPGATVRGSLWTEYDPLDLDEDLLQVSLGNGVTIDVGWKPDCDPSGAFQIAVYKGYYKDRLAPLIRTKDPHEAAAAVTDLAIRFGGEVAPLVGSELQTNSAAIQHT